MFTNDQLNRETVKLKRFAYKLTQHREEAEDIYQSTVLKALEKKHQFQPQTNLFSWASKIMFNLFISEYRRKKHMRCFTDAQGTLDREAVNPALEASVDIETITRAMDTLAEDHRTIITLVCINGMSYADAAKQLQIQVGTVRSRLSRARDALALALQPTHVLAAGTDLSRSHLLA